MTDKKVEPMTLDEFEKLLYKARKEAAEYWDKDHRTTQHSEGVYDGLDQAYEFFERFRPALEAGMRGVLRFQIWVRDCYTEDECYIAYLLGVDGKKIKGISGSESLTVVTDKCIEFADALEHDYEIEDKYTERLTAVFVEEEGS